MRCIHDDVRKMSFCPPCWRSCAKIKGRIEYDVSKTSFALSANSFPTQQAPRFRTVSQISRERFGLRFLRLKAGAAAVWQ